MQSFQTKGSDRTVGCLFLLILRRGESFELLYHISGKASSNLVAEMPPFSGSNFERKMNQVVCTYRRAFWALSCSFALEIPTAQHRHRHYLGRLARKLAMFAAIHRQENGLYSQCGYHDWIGMRRLVGAIFKVCVPFRSLAS